METKLYVSANEVNEDLLRQIKALVGTGEVVITIGTQKTGRNKPKPDFAKMTTDEILEAYPEYAKEIDERSKEAKENPESLISVPRFKSSKELKDYLRNEF